MRRRAGRLEGPQALQQERGPHAVEADHGLPHPGGRGGPVQRAARQRPRAEADQQALPTEARIRPRRTQPQSGSGRRPRGRLVGIPRPVAGPGRSAACPGR